MTNTATVNIERVRINGRILNSSLLRQLYEEKPFNNEFELLYNIKGKVFQKSEFVVFETPTGPKKFDISKYKTKTGAASLESNLFCSLHNEFASSELNHIRSSIREYYQTLAIEAGRESYEYDLFYSLDYGTAGYSKFERENSYDSLLNMLRGDFKDKVIWEYNKSVEKIEKRNQLVDIFKNTPQIFV